MNIINNLGICDDKLLKDLVNYYTPETYFKKLDEVLTPKAISFYQEYYNSLDLGDVNISIFRRLSNEKLFNAPHVLIKKGQTSKRFNASYLTKRCAFKDGVYGISFNTKTSNADYRAKILKAITAFLNSQLATYIFFLTNSSWGVERPQYMLKEIFSIPALPFEMPEEKVGELAQKVDEISVELSKDFPDEKITQRIEEEIDKIIYKALNLSKREEYLIEDVLDYSLDLFQEGRNSPAYYPALDDELQDYLEIICEDFNEHFAFSDTGVWASIQQLPAKNPMRLVAIHFTEQADQKGNIETVSHSKEITQLIREIDQYSYEKYTASVYFRKVVKYYTDDTIYIIKPNQKRFWSRSQAIQDSNSILLEIANMTE